MLRAIQVQGRRERMSPRSPAVLAKGQVQSCIWDIDVYLVIEVNVHKIIVVVVLDGVWWIEIKACGLNKTEDQGKSDTANGNGGQWFGHVYVVFFVEGRKMKK